MEKGVSTRQKGETKSGIQMVSRQKEKGTGAGVYCHGTRWKLSFSLGQYTTVLQAEVYAIRACTDENIDRKYKNRNIYILSDSQAAIKALGKHHITSKIVLGHQSLIYNWPNITEFN
jgi:hypothetical protein